MSNTYDGCYALVLWSAWELARYQQLVDWAVGVCGAVTLIALNVIRIRRALMNSSDVNKSKGDESD